MTRSVPKASVEATFFDMHSRQTLAEAPEGEASAKWLQAKPLPSMFAFGLFTSTAGSPLLVIRVVRIFELLKDGVTTIIDVGASASLIGTAGLSAGDSIAEVFGISVIFAFVEVRRRSQDGLSPFRWQRQHGWLTFQLAEHSRG